MEPPKQPALAKKPPRVPIETYRWEDVRRERRKGGYPWTYLDKEPFGRNGDQMESISRSKSSSLLPKVSEAMSIQDVTQSLEEHNLTAEPSSYIVITEVPSDSESHSKRLGASSVTIEDLDEPLNLEYDGSSDNISQYLEKEPTPPKQDEREKRARSEEVKRKRKLSIDSRKSLSKLAFLKKLRLPSLKPKKPEEKPKKKEAVRAPDSTTKPPVYVFIPLKPPEGQTDEFSYLEFGEKPPEEIPPKDEQEPKHEEEENPDDIIAFEILKRQSIDSESAAQKGLETGNDYLIIQQDDDAKSENIIIMMPKIEEEKKPLSRSNSQKTMPTKRAKSVEPEPKRKLSIESGHSRRSLSKLTILKKLKDAKDKIKLWAVSKEEVNEPVVVPPPVVPKPARNVTPQYIHIPLKPPSGETDQFSYLEFAGKDAVEVEVEKKEEVESPVSVPEEGVQFIFVTPPSDDEILDQPDIPETPAVESTVEKPQFFEKITELKELASKAIDEVAPEETEQVEVDEEDGLKMKPDDVVPKRKKVSFKRRSRDDSKDYEEIEAVPNILATSQSMSVDEEKSYLDEKKIIKEPSLEEDYNRWSKLSDHEYEPVNPPPEVKAPEVETTSVEEMQTQIEDRFFNQVHVQEPEPQEPESAPEEPPPPSRFQAAFKTQTEKIRSKLHEIKKPNIKLKAPKITLPKLPERRKISLPKLPERRKISLPKLPDRAKLSFPTFSLPRKNKKEGLKQRQFSTESNAGDSKTNYFDFRTFPRLFKKKEKDELDSFSSKSEKEADFATYPRTKRNTDDEWSGQKSIRIPLHSDDIEDIDETEPSHVRYDDDIDIDEDFEKENQEIHHQVSPFNPSYSDRWNHGSFQDYHGRNEQITDLDAPELPMHSSESSLGIHRQGVLEEIDSDEFFLRQKGISQDNIEVGAYLSSEIREAFKAQPNALADLHQMTDSNQSLPEPKRKPGKKPKRKKTPHVSHEQISFEQDSEPETTPCRPKRRSKRYQKTGVVPYQETITPEDEVPFYPDSEEEELGEPIAPPRRHISLNFSEQDSILGESLLRKEYSLDENLFKNEHEYIIPTPELPPIKPKRTLSRSSSKDPERPPRSRSLSRSRPESLVMEVMCVQDLRDHMGYAVVDKNQRREPPLPPPRTPERKNKFFTVPRSDAPTRPVRNYSTLGPSRPPRRKPVNMTDEEKENIDITQYIEIDEEPRDLSSGKVIQKMKDRPLPAPPRPPRRGKVLHDNMSGNIELMEEKSPGDEDREVAVTPPIDETGPIETDVRRELITPVKFVYEEETITHGTLIVEPLNGAKILPDSELTRIIPITREDEDDEETSEIPEEFTKLKDPSPVEVFKPQDPVRITAQIDPEIEVLKAHKLQVTDLDVDRLSVNELLANRITVSEIDSGGIQANEISSKTGALQIGEISLPPSVIQQLFEKMQGQKKTPIEAPLEKEEIRVESSPQPEPPTRSDSIQELPPKRPPRKDSDEIKPPRDLVPQEAPLRSSPEKDSDAEPNDQPKQEPIRSDDAQLGAIDGIASEADDLEPVPLLVPISDSEDPPPRPPDPEYFPSQPPMSFYALRAQEYIETGDIPLAPRRRRHHKGPRILPSKSSSDEQLPPPRRRHRSPEPSSIPQLSSQLAQACCSAANHSFKRLMNHVYDNVFQNMDGQQDLHVIIVILIVLIAGLILLGYGDGKTVHHHHWEYFNPPRDL